MTLKINYLDRIKDLSKNMALFLGKDAKISDFKGIFDDEINQKILNFQKNNKKTQKNKIASLNLEFDQKIIVILIVNKNNSQQAEELGAKFYDHAKNNEIDNLLILGSSASSIKTKIKLDEFFFTIGIIRCPPNTSDSLLLSAKSILLFTVFNVDNNPSEPTIELTTKSISLNCDMIAEELFPIINSILLFLQKIFKG